MKKLLLLAMVAGPAVVGAQWKGFSTFTSNAVPENIHTLHAKDITGDGIADITALPTASGEKWYLLKGKGDNNFQTAKERSKPVNYQLSDIADLDGDGFPELVVSSYWDNGFRIFKGSADNNFSQSTYYSTCIHGRAIKCTDINKDGYTDIVTVTSGSGRTIHLHVFINKGNGEFYEKKTFPSVLDTSKDIFITDKNNDGLPDVVVSSSFAWIVMFLQLPDGSFEPHYYPTGTMAQVAIADTDKDNKEDLLLLYTSFDNMPGSDSLILKRNTGDSSFSTSITIPQLAQYHIRPTMIKVADVNKDGWPDIFINHCDEEGNITDTLYYMIAKNANSYNAPVPIILPDTILTWELADINNDKAPDLIVATANKSIQVALSKFENGDNDKPVEIKVFPNPATTTINISNLPATNCTVQLFTTAGTLIYNQSATNTTHSIPVQQLPTGIYYLRITQSGKAVYSTGISILCNR